MRVTGMSMDRGTLPGHTIIYRNLRHGGVGVSQLPVLRKNIAGTS